MGASFQFVRADRVETDRPNSFLVFRLETVVLMLLLILAITGLTLAVFFFVGSFFLQGYMYTEPSPQLYWQAPAAGAILTVFLLLWCFMIVRSPGAKPEDIPYDTIFRFSPRVDLLEKPAKELWAVTRKGEEIPYQRKRLGQNDYRYYDPKTSRPWNPDVVKSIKLVDKGESFLFHEAPSTEGGNRSFVSDQGWVIRDFGNGPDGIPTVFRWSRFFINLFLNLSHFLLWYFLLWLVLRFAGAHALGLGASLWLIFTLAVLPMLLHYAAEVAQRSGPTI